jgi:hypothetical protein
MGKGKGKERQTERYRNAEKANHVSLCTTEDCCGATRSMG